jgi:multidrug resistance efflux pump
MAIAEQDSTLQPRFRDDLECNLQHTSTSTTFIVKIQQLDGSTPVETIRQRVEKHFDAPLDTDTLRSFVESLRQRGLLEGAKPAAESTVGTRPRIRGSVLYRRFEAFDPDHLLTLLDAKTRFLFTRQFVIFSLVCLAAAISLIAIHGDDMRTDMLRLIRPSTAAVGWFVIFAIAVIHEFAHGLTCKHFGGRVREMGFMLLFFLPALYCNVSDAWLFPEKSKRLWVGFAGAYSDLLVWAFAVFAWRITAPETALNYVALVIIALTGIRILVNLNPLIKLDGYYLLGDYLEIPNLRDKAFAYLQNRIRRHPGSGKDRTNTVGSRERRVYVTYGISAALFTVLLLGYVLSLFSGFLIQRLQGTGFIILVLLTLYVFRNRLAQMFQKIAKFRLQPAGYRSVKRGVFRSLVVAAGLAVLILGRMELTVSGEFEAGPVENADVRAEVEAIIAAVYVDEGQRVEKGQPLARLSSRDYSAELAKVEADIQEQRARLRLLSAGPTVEEIAVARAEVERERTRHQHAQQRYEEAERVQVARANKAQSEVAKARDTLAFAKKEHARVQALAESKVVPSIQLDEAEERVAVAENELDAAVAELQMVRAGERAELRQELAVAAADITQAKARLTELQAGSRSEEIEATQAIIKRLQAQQHYLEEALRLVDVVSPIAGVVTTPKVKEKVGELMEKGDLILEIYYYETLKVETLVSEKDVGEVRVGYPVTLKARAYPHRSFKGWVTAIAPTAMADDQAFGRKVVRVTTEIDNPELILKPDMTGNAKIYCGQRRIIELLTRRLVRYLRVEFWSWW